MTRRVSFSAGHRYWFGDRTAAQNRQLFGEWASPFNHGHNYVLDVTVSGAVDSSTGMVVNIKVIDEVLRRCIVRQFDQRSINDEVPHFLAVAPTVENLLLYCASSLRDELPAQCTLTTIRLEETPLLYGELHVLGTQIMTLTRIYEFAAAHRLDSLALSPEQNVELYGKCNNVAGHGHNYLLEVTVTGTPDSNTGMLADIGAVDDVVRRVILDRYDHKNLNEDLEEFSGLPTTSEVVATQIFSSLESALPVKLFRIRLHETARNMFEICAP